MTSRALVLLTVTLVGCGDGGGFPDAPVIDAPAAPGTFSLQWAVTNSAGSPITCNEIGAQAITVVAHNRAVQGAATEVFTCSTLAGTSQSLIPGTYDLAFDLNGVGGDPVTGVIATAPQQAGVVITSGQNTPLMPLSFAVNATGGMRLKIVTTATGGNCAAPAQNGAGITTNRITLTKVSDGICAPVTFNVSAGTMGGTAGTYVVDCTTPVDAPCIERDQELTVTNLASGSYGISIRASKTGSPAATDCYTGIDQLPVPPLGRELVRSLNLGAISPPCP